MNFSIISPDTTLYQGEVSLIQLPGVDGLFEILNQHAPLVSVLKKGKVRMIDQNNKEILIEIEGGIFEVSKNEARLFAL
ncbi:MAG: hypothetical protein RRX93_04770 [Bacteroidales bacterium]